MCGRFSFSIPSKAKSLVKLGVPQAEVDILKPRYNIAPSNSVASIRNEKERHIEPLRWGLIPSWSKNESIGARMINARVETLAEKPSFKALLHKHRCLILADGFYEWAESARGKQPYLIRLKSAELLTFAGLWSHWKDSKGKEIRTCTIITCASNKLMERIHNRMPVILDAEARDIWLDPKTEDSTVLTGILKPFPDSEMEAYPVSKLVNSPENDNIECIKPLGETKT